MVVFRYPEDPSRDFIKRCVAVAGQTVEIRDKVLYVDGKAPVEPYVVHKDPRIIPRETYPRDNYGPYVVPQGHLFMMGDNRDNSQDSRFWGYVPRSAIIGRAMFVYWSFDESAPSSDAPAPVNYVLDFINNTRWSRTGTFVK